MKKIKTDKDFIDKLLEQRNKKCKTCEYYKVYGDDCVLCIFGGDFYVLTEGQIK